ncbi:hypothetical protein ABZ723_05400 [Streptomyces sp. NPDC006700]|uniref:hypothetical protein n=1 Tax=Streptomyces sp. NPDC006700 TaxID=3154479 RepID=UPI0033DA9C4E
MTACMVETPAAGEEKDGTPRAGCTITVDGAYAARLAGGGDSLYPERWTLDGPEPYAVPLPANQPEEPGTEVLPMGDGRVLIRRLVDGRHTFSLLYPTGPGTGELPLGAIECPEGAGLRLLPPAPGGERAYALAVGRRSSAVWLVVGGAFGPEHLAEVPGRCSGGVWLDHAGRMLALDRETGGRTKAVVVDLECGGETSPLLQIAAGSDDRLLLADPDSGLLLIRSDAPSPGRSRLGWGVLGSTQPVRFPECLRLPDCVVTPFAIQPGQVLTPEQCGVALRCDGAFGSWVAVWRPAERQVRHLPAPEGWLAGSGLWTDDGVLHLPCSTNTAPCGVVRWTSPASPASPTSRSAPTPRPEPGPTPEPAGAGIPLPAPSDAPDPLTPPEPHPGTDPGPRAESEPSASPEPAAAPGPRADPDPRAEFGPPAPGEATPREHLAPDAGTHATLGTGFLIRTDSGALPAPRAAPETGPHDVPHPALDHSPALESGPPVSFVSGPAPRPVPLQQAPLGRLVTK